jgi:hypothetical protein
MNLPVILTSDDPQVLAALRRDLNHATGRTIACWPRTPAKRRSMYSRNSKPGRCTGPADQAITHCPDAGRRSATRCREIYPNGGPVLLNRIFDVKAAIRGINDARLDHYLEKPGIRRRNISIPRSTIFSQRSTCELPAGVDRPEAARTSSGRRQRIALKDFTWPD